MPRRRPRVSIANYGQYTPWDKNSRKLPKLLKYTDTIEAIDGNEFGVIIDVDDAKGKVLQFSIKHPPLRDDEGNLLPDFRGELFVNTHHMQFFVGDGIWLPVEDKIGLWEVLIWLDDQLVVHKKFSMVAAGSL